MTADLAFIHDYCPFCGEVQEMRVERSPTCTKFVCTGCGATADMDFEDWDDDAGEDWYEVEEDYEEDE